MKIYNIVLTIAALTTSSFNAYAVTRTADPTNIDDIVAWAVDGKTTKIEFPNGVYEFSKRLVIGNNGLILKGTNRNKTILRLTRSQAALIDATGNNTTVTDLTLDGNNVQTNFGQPIFRFNKSKGHRFERVLFTHSSQFGISGPPGWATDGLYVNESEFHDIKGIVINVLNRDTLKRGEVVTEIEKIIIENSIFREGYSTGITLDAGNDRSHDTTSEAGKRIGRRYNETVDMNESVYKNNVFEKTRGFHIAAVQASNFLIIRNELLGMSDDAGGGANAIHFEQFSRDIQIYNNNFYMADSVAKKYPYINISATEGHKRVTQKRQSDTYPTWTFNVDGSNERRADTSCASSGNVDKDCKRDVHAYGTRNLYIAGNTFNDSTKISDYLAVKEGENIQVGTKKGGTILLNNFAGGDNTTKKVTFSGSDEGTCNVNILEGQNVVASNVNIKKVTFDSPHCSNTKPIIINGTQIGGKITSNDTDDDGDGLLNSIDPDDDNDGVVDEADAFPLNIKYSAPGKTFTFNVTDDADVFSDRVDTNLGSVPVFKLFSGRRHGYVKFNVTGLDNAAGDLLSSKLWLVNHSNDPIIGRVDIHATPSNWQESTVTWNLKNSLNNLVNSKNFNAQTSNFNLDITDHIKGDGKYSFGITADVDGKLYTKEDSNGANQAYIEVVMAVPSPDADGDGIPDLVDADFVGVMLGDLDGNGAIDQSDARIFRSTLGSSQSDKNFNLAADMDEDGLITRRDYSLFIGALKRQAAIAG